MVDKEIEHGEQSRHQDQNRDERHKERIVSDENEEEVEVLPDHIKKNWKDKNFQKVMKILLNKEKEKYFLKLAQEGAKLPHHFDVETISTPEEETETSKLKK